MTNPETSSDLVKRLRYRVNNPSAWQEFEQSGSDLFDEAASAIERLTAEIERLTPLAVAYEYLESPARADMAEAEVARLSALNARQAEALKPFALEAHSYDPVEDDDDRRVWDSRITLGDLRRARALATESSNAG